MANNPYTPPTADVAGRPEPRVAPGPMPLNVQIALVILTGLEVHALYNLNLARLWERIETGEVPLFLILAPFVPHVLYIALVTCIFFRKNWARVGLLVLFGFSLLAQGFTEYVYSRAMPPGMTVKRDVLDMLIAAALLAARLATFVLLFTRPANAWFRPRAAS